MSRVPAGDQPAVDAMEEGRAEEATLRERSWVKVGWQRDNGNGSGEFRGVGL